MKINRGLRLILLTGLLSAQSSIMYAAEAYGRKLVPVNISGIGPSVINLPEGVYNNSITYRQLSEIAANQLGYPVKLLVQGQDVTNSDQQYDSGEMVMILKASPRSAPSAEELELRKLQEEERAAKHEYEKSLGILKNSIDRISIIEARTEIYRLLTQNNVDKSVEYDSLAMI